MVGKIRKLKLPFRLKLHKRLRKILIIFLVLFSLAALLFKFKHLFIVALVNSQPITRYSLDRELEKQGGKQVLESLIAESLILQEARRQRIRVSQEELEDEVRGVEERLSAQGTNLESLLQTQGQTRKDLEEQIKIQLIVEKILGQEISLSEEEVRNYFEENRELFPEKVSFEEVKGDLEKELGQQRMTQKFQSWLEGLKGKAKIDYFLRL